MSLNNQLDSLESTGLIRPIDTPANLAYLFRHALIQEAAYRSLVKSTRKQLHHIIGDILEQVYVSQIDQFASLLAEHFLEAGDAAKAAVYFRRAGEWATNIGAPIEALQSFKQALALIPESDSAARGQVSLNIGLVYQRQSEYAAATEWHQRALTLAQASADQRLAAQVLSELAAVAVYQGDYAQARTSAEAALQLSRAQNDQTGMALALRWLSVVSAAQDDYEAAIPFCTESLALYTELNDRRGMGICTNSLGIFALDQGRLAEAQTYIEQAVALSREIGDRYALGNRLMNLGTIAATAGNTQQAKAYYAESLSISREAGAQEDVATTICNLGDVALKEEDVALAQTYYRDALGQALVINAQPLMLFTLAGLADITERQGHHQRAAEWLGLIQNHPTHDAQLIKQVQPTLATLRANLSAQEFEAALRRGAQLNLEKVAEEILAETASRP
jgi:tetratricopeptide (TPR) repeat protein